MLVKLGHSVRLAENGEDAVRLYKGSLVAINAYSSLTSSVTRVPKRTPIAHAVTIVASVPEEMSYPVAVNVINSEHAIDVVDPKRFDICLMDISMPV